jgi:hypothetical protein
VCVSAELAAQNLKKVTWNWVATMLIILAIPTWKSRHRGGVPAGARQWQIRCAVKRAVG